VENLLQPLLAGFICGFVVAVPVGPVNLTVINHALRKGFVDAFLVGAGAVAAETMYAALMLWGHASILDEPRVVLALRIVAVVVITALGIRYLVYKPVLLNASEAKAEKAEERWHHPRSLFLGFALTISNFMLVVLWATLVTLLFAHEWVVPVRQSRLLCATGIFLGGLVWFFLLAFFVSRAHRRVKNETLLVLVRSCGVLFLGFAALLAYKLVVLLTAN
jgi:threonine/homoserine/homoserine lactone efflux protein